MMPDEYAEWQKSKSVGRVDQPDGAEDVVLYGETTVPSPSAGEGIRVLLAFNALLREVTGDGQRKRRAGRKPPWWVDDSHEAAIFSHLNAWKHGHKKDKDSGAHPLVHLAWRALAIAYQESVGMIDPEKR